MNTYKRVETFNVILARCTFDFHALKGLQNNQGLYSCKEKAGKRSSKLDTVELVLSKDLLGYCNIRCPRLLQICGMHYSCI